MAFSRTTSRVEVAREGLAVFRTPISKGSPMVYGLGFLLGGTSQHLLRGWFLQKTGYEPECAVEGQPVPAQQSPFRERRAASGPSGTSTRRRAFEGVWAAVGAFVRTPATIPLQMTTPSRSGRDSFRRGRDEPGRGQARKDSDPREASPPRLACSLVRVAGGMTDRHDMAVPGQHTGITPAQSARASSRGTTAGPVCR